MKHAKEIENKKVKEKGMGLVFFSSEVFSPLSFYKTQIDFFCTAVFHRAGYFQAVGSVRKP